MVSTLDGNGLAIDSKPTIIAALIAAMQAIYGSDINVDSNSPDGQLINVFAQVDEDFLELLLATYNLSAVPTAFGTRLDQLVALNGLARKQGTYTIAFVNIISTQALTLPGLNQNVLPPFTVADNAGNQFELVTTLVFATPGNPTVAFRAVNIGQVQTTANTITNIITSTLGIASVNNPDTSTDEIGTNEETDAQLKVRHAQSFTLAQTGPSDSLESALRNIADIVDAFVVENNTGAPVGGIGANSIWVITNGGADADIAQAIYAKKSPGCGMTGAKTAIVTRPNGQTFTAQWDEAVSQPLYVKFSVIWKGAQILSNTDLANGVAANLPVYKLGEQPTISDVIKAAEVVAPTAIVEIDSATQGVSRDDSAWESVVTPTTFKNYFVVLATNVSVT